VATPVTVPRSPIAVARTLAGTRSMAYALPTPSVAAI
jgi:hypothetical protein